MPIFELTEEQVALLRRAVDVADDQDRLGVAPEPLRSVLDHPLDTIALNPGRWNGQAFWSGVADLNGEILAVYQYEIATDADFHVDFYIEHVEAFHDGDVVFFYINNGILNTEDKSGNAVAAWLAGRIREQIYITGQGE